MNDYTNERILGFIAADKSYLEKALATNDTALAHTMAKGIMLSAAELVERLERDIKAGN